MRVNKVIKHSGYKEQRESNNRHIHYTNQSKDNNIHTSFSEVLKNIKQKTH
jgi:hypothetical protein